MATLLSRGAREASASSVMGNQRHRSRTIYRHALPVRIMHWVNFLCLSVLLLSGLQIFNAHPALYWGEVSHFDDPLLSMEARSTDAGVRGVTVVLGREFDTTGFLGASTREGVIERRAFPDWLTVPGPRWLAMGRRWHFFFAWLFVLNGLAYVAWSLWSRHLTRDLVPTRRDWRSTGRTIIDHALLRRPKGEEAERYNVLQKLSYLVIIYVLGPSIVLMGIAMSPQMDVALGWLLDLVGGRQSARTIHFVIALGLVLFFLVHIFQVLVTGVVNNLRSMITGRFRIDDAEGSK